MQSSTPGSRPADPAGDAERLLASVPDVIARFDSELRFTYVNPAIQKLTRRPPAFFLGKTPLEAGFPPPLVAHLQAALREVFASGTGNTIQIDIEDHRGTVRCLTGTAVPELDSLGRVVSVLTIVRDVTEQRRSERALEETERRYQRIFNAVKASIWEEDFSAVRQDLDTLEMKGVTNLSSYLDAHPEFVAQAARKVRICDVNQATLDLFRARSKSELLASLDGIFLEETLPAFRRQLEAIFHEEPFVESETVVRTLTGERINVTFAVTFPPGDRELKSVLVCLMETTQRRRAEHRIMTLNRDLARRVKEFETLLDVLPVGIGIATDPECRDIRVNPAFARMLNVGPQENSSKSGPTADRLPFRVFRDGVEVPGQDLPMQVAAREGRAIRDMELEIVRADGTTMTELAFASPLFDESDKVRGAIGVFLDITERKRSLVALEESERHFRLLADSAPVLIWMSDSANLGTWFNKPWLEFTGRGMEQELGEGWLESVHPEDRGPCSAHCTASFEKREPFSIEFRMRRRDGHYRWILDHGIPRFDANGAFAGYIGSCIDITDRRGMEDTLRTLNRELEEFAFVASHDLREPLRMVNVYTQLLVRRFAGAEDAEAREFGDLIQNGVRRMENLLRDLLSYSRLIVASGEEDAAAPQTADLAESFEIARAALEAAIQQSRASIRISGELPRVAADPAQCAHVFQNLLSNSIKYAAPATPPDVEISAERRGPDWVISIRDRGIGFDPQYASRIFGLFKRLHKDDYPGTGLGLAICKRLVERNGGRIWAESTPGAGSVFHFSLPAVAGS